MKQKKFHYSPTKGIFEECNAFKKPCPFGELLHFKTEKEAQNFCDDWNDVRERFHIETHDIESHMKRISKSLMDTPLSDKKRTELAYCKSILQGEYFKNNIESILKEIQTPDGGGTYNPHSSLSPQVGFCYSPYPEYSKVISKDMSALESVQHVMDYMEKYSKNLEKENHYLGFWNDPETGNIYLDISVTTMDANEARKECEEHDQIAFFDLQTFNSVTVDRNATSGQGVS